MGRPPCCDKSNVKRGLWTPEEDAKILAYVSNHGIGNWTLVPKKAGLNRCGKSCRLRWTNYLRPDLKHDKFTPEEEDLIIKLHKAIGSRWSLIAKELPGRTDNDVKNYWNTKLRKKLQKMGIDPVTHKPISQILSDYGNISGIRNAANYQVGSLDRSFNSNLMMMMSEPSSAVLTRPSTSDMVMKSVNEQVQDTSSSSVSYPTSWDLLHFFNEASSSSCSSSTSAAFARFTSQKSQPQAPITHTSSSQIWSEFLLNDLVFSADLQHQQGLDFHQMLSPTESSTMAQNDHRSCNPVGNNADAASSSASSFVDGILDKDREMSSQFPELFDPAFDF